MSLVVTPTVTQRYSGTRPQSTDVPTSLSVTPNGDYLDISYTLDSGRAPAEELRVSINLVTNYQTYTLTLDVNSVTVFSGEVTGTSVGGGQYSYTKAIVYEQTSAFTVDVDTVTDSDSFAIATGTLSSNYILSRLQYRIRKREKFSDNPMYFFDWTSYAIGSTLTDTSVRRAWTYWYALEFRLISSSDKIVETTAQLSSYITQASW